MLTVQRASRSKFPKPSKAPESRVEDDAIENELVSLLGQLDFLREKMVLARDEGRRSELLALLEELLKQVSAFADEQIPFHSSLEMKAAESQANEFRSSLHRLKKGEDPKEEDTISQQAFTALQESVLAYFSAFTRRFSTSLAARSWVDVAATFVVDLKQIPQTSV